jgi:hypothetical protein
MAQQTAVAWLMSEMLKPDMYKIWVTLLERAKEMEKQQIIKAYHKGLFGNMELNSNTFADKYYNDTYV